MAPQDLTIEDLLGHASEAGATPAETASGLLRWRGDLTTYGRQNKGPEDYWKGTTRLDQDLAPVLDNLRQQEGMRILREAVPDEQRPLFLNLYGKAAGKPEDLPPQYQEPAKALNALGDDPRFSLDQGIKVLTLHTDDGKPLADAVVRGNEALVRPLKEGGKPFIVPVNERSPEELGQLALQAEESAMEREMLSQNVGGGTIPILDAVVSKAMKDSLLAEARSEKEKAAIYKSGDPAALAALDIGQTIKADENLLGQIADKSLGDRFQAGVLRASVNTARALDDLKDLVFNQGQGGPSDQFAGFEEALAAMNVDTARAFRATAGDKTLAAAAESMGQMAPSLLPYGAAMRAGRAVASELGAAATMAPGSYGAELGQLMDVAKQAEDAGDMARADQLRSVARWSSLLQAGIDTGTEMMFKETSGAIRGGVGALKRLASAPIKEGIEEVAAGTAERGVKQPLFYPEDMQQPLTEGAGIEFAAGAIASAPIQAAVEGPRVVRDLVNRRTLPPEKKKIFDVAAAGAPDAGTLRELQKIEDMAAFDLPEEGVTAGEVLTAPPADATLPPAPQPPVDATAATPSVVETPAVVPPPQVEDAVGPPGSSVVEEPPPAVPPLQPEEILATPPTEQEGVAPPVAETTDPTVEGSAPGGVSDPDTSAVGPATGSSAPAVSNEQVESIVPSVKPLVSDEIVSHLRSLATSATVGENGLRFELGYYSPEERAFLAQLLGTQDASPAALAKAIRYQEEGPTRYSAAEATPTGRMTEAQARAALGSVPRNVTFISDPAARTPWGLPWAGKADRQTGQVTINLAHVNGTEDLRARLTEEMLHIVWQDPRVRAAVADLEAAVTPAMREDMARLGYEPGMQTEEAATRMVDRITRTPDGRSAWRRLLDAVRSALRRLFRMEPDARQVEAAARGVLHYAMNERVQPEAIPTPAEPQPKGPPVMYANNLPAGTNVTLSARTTKGEMVELTMDAQAAQAMLTKRKSALEALRDCL